jgi:hypothetical protein
MKQKLFLGIILIITIISSMLITVTEGVCNYDDGGGIGAQTIIKWTKKCYGFISAAEACKKDLGKEWSATGKEKPCPTGGLDAMYQCKSKGSSSGAPVSSRTDDACNQGTIYDNEERLKQAELKLNELKRIAAKVDQGVLKINRKGILGNLRAAKELASAGGDGDGSDENPACDKYPEACSDDENDGYPAPPTDSNYSAALKG